KTPMLNIFDTDSKVNSVAFSPNGKMIATGGEGYNIKLWEVFSKKEIFVLLILITGSKTAFIVKYLLNVLFLVRMGRFLLLVVIIMILNCGI
ncbi:MAG: WD40 repeat domain-containing protein, partial [Cyanobacteria bacterium J06649_11]